MQQPIQMSDPVEATEDLLRRKLAAKSSRRTMLQRAGLITAAIAGANLMPTTRRGSFAEAATEVATFKPSTGKGFKVNVYDILTFALNLEYLEATFFCHAGFGADINTVAGEDVTSGPGEGTLMGTLPTVPNSFVSPATIRLAQELAQVEVAHIKQLRTVLGKRLVGRPTLDIPGGFSTEYAALFAKAGLTTSEAPATFSPFSTDGVLGDAGFLVGAFGLEDVGTTAYNGAAPFLSGQYLADAASILAAEAYHAGAVRYALYNYAISYPNELAFLVPVANSIVGLENSASAEGNSAAPPTAQPLVVDVNGVSTPFFVNADPVTGFVFARNFAQVLNIVYLDSGLSPTPGGFFPNGFNGRIR